MKHLLIVENGKILLSASIERFVIHNSEEESKVVIELTQEQEKPTIISGYIGPV